jgi:hypothetical protein
MGNEHTTKARTLQGTDETPRAETHQSKKRAWALEGEIGIAGSVGGLHGAVAGERGGDAEFLLSPIDARNLQNYKTGNFVCGSSGRRNELRPSPAYLTLPGGQASRLQEPSFRIWSCHVG